MGSGKTDYRFWALTRVAVFLKAKMLARRLFTLRRNNFAVSFTSVTSGHFILHNQARYSNT